MTWKKKTVIRILLLVAQMLADGDWREEIEHLANHIAMEPAERLELMKQ